MTKRILTEEERQKVYKLFRRKGIDHIISIDRSNNPIYLPLSTLTQDEIVDRVPRLIGGSLSQFLESNQ